MHKNQVIIQNWLPEAQGFRAKLASEKGQIRKERQILGIMSISMRN